MRPTPGSILILAIMSLSTVVVPATAQVPIPMQEQIEVYRSLPPAQQQSLIRELQRQLPPAQRESVISMLMEQSGQSTPARDSVETEIDPGALAADIASGVERGSSGGGRLRAGDTLVIEFMPQEDPLAAIVSAVTDSDAVLREQFLERLQDGNPYVLDEAGRLLMPGVRAIALAGLNVEQATARIGAERDLRSFDIVVIPLDLDPVDVDALEPFGYDIFRNSASTFAPAMDIPIPADYTVGPGDTINIALFGSQNDQFFLPVSPEGTINFPEIGPIGVSGMSFDAVRDDINLRVSQQMIGVRASITLGELRSIRVMVVGDVLRPGSFNVSSLATMANALRISGGISETGSLRQIALMREGETVATLDLYDLLLRGDNSNNARLRSEDVIFVPPLGPTVTINGEVRRPAIYELNGEEAVPELVELAGGLLANADPGALRLERIVSGRGISVLNVNLTTASGRDVSLRDGDVLRVPRNLDQLDGSVRLVGNVQREGVYQWFDGMTVSDLLPGPELVKTQSDLNYVLIRREPRANIEIRALSVDLAAVWAGQAGAADLALEPRDTVYVFHLETGRQQYVRPVVEELESQSGPNEPLPVVRIRGRVRAEGEYPLEPGMRVADLLRAGGGLTDAAYAEEAELTRYQVINGEYRQTELVTIDLASVRAGNIASNVALAPYDILSIREISNWTEQGIVTLRGEFDKPGEYTIRLGETMRSVLERAGGLTDYAFPEGSVFTRVSAREREQAQLELYARQVESDLVSRALTEQGSSSDVMETREAVVAEFRNARATGRTVIRLDDIIAGRADSAIEMRNGDVLMVPKRSQEVTVTGEVQYRSTHIYADDISRDDYIARSGGLTRRADKKRIYIVRANGDVVADSGERWFRRDAGFHVRPGDTIVVPIDVDRMRPLSLWTSVTQIMYNMAIAAAAVNSF